MFFVQASKESAIALRAILTRYEEVLGQIINKEKSSTTFSRRAPMEVKRMVHDELQIQKEGGVEKYLGLPEHFGRRKRDLFTSIVEKIKQKAKSWTNRFLSLLGRWRCSNTYSHQSPPMQWLVLNSQLHYASEYSRLSQDSGGTIGMATKKLIGSLGRQWQEQRNKEVSISRTCRVLTMLT